MPKDMFVNEQVIQAYLQSHFSSFKENGNRTEFMLPSPFFGGHGYKLYISKEGGKWIDFRGQGDPEFQGDFDKFVSLVEKIPRTQAKKKLIDLSLSLGINVLFDKNNTGIVYNKINKLPVPFPDSKPAALHPIAISYLARRGVTKELAEKYSLGYNSIAHSIVLPFFHNNEPVYYIERLIGNVAMRWRNAIPPSNMFFGKNDIFFGEQTVESDEDILFLAEGSFDSITITKYGFQSIALNGAVISNEQIEFINLNGIKKIALAFDFDETGIKATHNVARRIQAYTDAVIYFNHTEKLLRIVDEYERDTNKKADWNELSEDVFMTYVSGLEKYTKFSILKSKIGEM